MSNVPRGISHRDFPCSDKQSVRRVLPHENPTAIWRFALNSHGVASCGTMPTLAAIVRFVSKLFHFVRDGVRFHPVRAGSSIDIHPSLGRAVPINAQLDTDQTEHRLSAHNAGPKQKL